LSLITMIIVMKIIIITIITTIIPIIRFPAHDELMGSTYTLYYLPVVRSTGSMWPL